MQLDQATGLYYDNARYYNPATGTFLSQDPKGFAGGTTNLHAYVNNDPINLIDPTGLSPKGNSGGGPGGPGGGPGGGGSDGGGSGGGGGSNTPGAYHYTDDQLNNNSWFDNFVASWFGGSDEYGTAGQVTQPQWVDDTVEVSQDVSTVAFTGAAVLSGVAEVDAVVDGVQALAEEAQAINSASEAAELENLASSQSLVDEGASINEDVTAAEANDAAAMDSVTAETEAINGEAAQAEANAAQAEADAVDGATDATNAAEGSGDVPQVDSVDDHHLQMQQFYGDNAGPLQDLPSDMHAELHDEIGQAIDDEFAGEGAPSGYNGGQAAWQQFFNDNPGAFDRADAIINMTTQDYMTENGIW
jgi:RHS repeat-associated protein